MLWMTKKKKKHLPWFFRIAIFFKKNKILQVNCLIKCNQLWIIMDLMQTTIRRTHSIWDSCDCFVHHVSSSYCDKATQFAFYSGPLYNHSKHCRTCVCWLQCYFLFTRWLECRLELFKLFFQVDFRFWRWFWNNTISEWIKN